MRTFALFVPFELAEEADEVMSQVFGSPQIGSFRKELSATGTIPVTHLGAYAANLDESQALILESQSILQVVETPWHEALAIEGLITVD